MRKYPVNHGQVNHRWGLLTYILNIFDNLNQQQTKNHSPENIWLFALFVCLFVFDLVEFLTFFFLNIGHG